MCGDKSGSSRHAPSKRRYDLVGDTLKKPYCRFRRCQRHTTYGRSAGKRSRIVASHFFIYDKSSQIRSQRARMIAIGSIQIDRRIALESNAPCFAGGNEHSAFYGFGRRER